MYWINKAITLCEFSRQTQEIKVFKSTLSWQSFYHMNIYYYYKLFQKTTNFVLIKFEFFKVLLIENIHCAISIVSISILFYIYLHCTFYVEYLLIRLNNNSI